MADQPTYYAEADALAKSYDRAIGWALQYGIKVYQHNSRGEIVMKCLGDLWDEIRAAEKKATVAA